MTDDEYRELQEEASMLSELTAHPGWQYLVDFSEARMLGKKRSVLNGGAKEWDDYLRDTAWLRGIHDTLDAAETVQKILDNERTRRAEKARALEDDGA